MKYLLMMMMILMKLMIVFALLTRHLLRHHAGHVGHWGGLLGQNWWRRGAWYKQIDVYLSLRSTNIRIETKVNWKERFDKRGEQIFKHSDLFLPTLVEGAEEVSQPSDFEAGIWFFVFSCHIINWVFRLKYDFFFFRSYILFGFESVTRWLVEKWFFVQEERFFGTHPICQGNQWEIPETIHFDQWLHGAFWNSFPDEKLIMTDSNGNKNENGEKNSLGRVLWP